MIAPSNLHTMNAAWHLRRAAIGGATLALFAVPAVVLARLFWPTLLDGEMTLRLFSFAVVLLWMSWRLRCRLRKQRRSDRIADMERV